VYLGTSTGRERNVTTQREQTLGEMRVRVTFNPSDSKAVDRIKTQTAALIDFCESLRSPQNARLIALAQTAYEEAAMWAVKAATG
jgi:hypothetical protein